LVQLPILCFLAIASEPEMLIANYKSRQVFWGFEQLSSTIDWRVMELQRLGQYGQLIPCKAKLGQLQRC